MCKWSVRFQIFWTFGHYDDINVKNSSIKNILIKYILTEWIMPSFSTESFVSSRIGGINRHIAIFNISFIHNIPNPMLSYDIIS